ncbi:MAG: hypothetical protein KBC41_04195 [Candidatus Pacebacteria bacterium]|nr:hypothetical protein [Candidatus Paceibacterota bacterium]MBP9867244.1 hypothetical protein [Candidatus Paceibacterota bacterium]
MNPDFNLRKQLEIYFFISIAIVAISYGSWRAYPLIRGPSITVFSPKDGDIVSSSTFQIFGRVSHVKNISVQGRPIPIDTDGNFSEILVSFSPYTIITLTATDFYDKTITKTLRVTPKK